jgi:hypothetical protein
MVCLALPGVLVTACNSPLPDDIWRWVSRSATYSFTCRPCKPLANTALQATWQHTGLHIGSGWWASTKVAGGPLCLLHRHHVIISASLQQPQVLVPSAVTGLHRWSAVSYQTTFATTANSTTVWTRAMTGRETRWGHMRTTSGSICTRGKTHPKLRFGTRHQLALS